MSRAEAKNPTVAQSDFGLSGDLATQNALPGFFFCGEEWLAGCEQGTGKKFLPRRTRIPLQAASSGAWLHRTRAPASFQWWGVLYRASAAHGHKNPSEKQGTGKKILPRRNRILGKWLFRRLTVGNTMKTLGFRNMLWKSGPWKNFLKVLCPARNLRESGSFGKVSYYKVWPYSIRTNEISVYHKKHILICH